MEAEEQLGHRQFSRTQNAWRQKNTCLFTARLYGENHTEKFQKCMPSHHNQQRRITLLHKWPKV